MLRSWLNRLTAHSVADIAPEAIAGAALDFSLVAHCTESAVLITDVQGQIEWVNAAFEQLTGYSLEEIRGRKPGEFLQGPQTDPTTIAYMREQVLQQRPFALDILNYRKSGEAYWVHIQAQPARAADGSITRFIAIENEVTARVQLTTSLRQSELNLRHLADTLPGMVFEWIGWDQEWPQFGFVGQGSREVLGLDAEALTQQSALFPQMLLPVEREPVLQAIRTALSTGEEWSSIFQVQLPDGARRWVRGRARPEAGHGVNVAYTGVLVDISAQKRIEAQLQESRQQLARTKDFLDTIIENLPMALFVKDAQNLAFVLWNRGAEQLFGYSAAAVLGKTDLELFLPEQACASQAKDRETLRRGELLTMQEEWARSPNQEARLLHTRKVPIQDVNGVPVAVLGLSEDITERKRIDEALRRRGQELAQANAELSHAVRLKDEFLATMSHELRTPLNSILALSEVLREQTHGPLNAPQLHYVDTIESSGQHLLALINDVLDVSKIEAGHMSLHPEPVDIRDLCEASLALVRQLAHKKGLQICLDLDPAAHTLEADPRRIKQVLVNLLSNAVKFTPVGKKIGLQAQLRADTAQLCLEVWDEGLGIATADQKRLFQPFVQLDSGLTRAYEGSGLGLALVRRLTELHGGQVELESTVGSGSRFRLLLPLSSPENPSNTAN